jgi:hypothetical protein
MSIAGFALFAWLEAAVLSLWLTLFLLGFVLAVTLWFGTMFAQAYFYTEPAAGLFWRGPVAAGILTSFFAFWSLVNVWGGSITPAGKVELPFPLLWEFNQRKYLVTKPVPQLEVKKKRGETVVYQFDPTQPKVPYKKVEGTERLGSVSEADEYIRFIYEGQEYRFLPTDRSEGANLVFVDANSGWEMSAAELGLPRRTSYWRLFGYFFVNTVHLLLWVACFWLLLRFALPHAALFAVVFWLAFTLIVFTVLFGRAEVAVKGTAQVAVVQPLQA